MESATPLNTALIENEDTLKSRQERLVTDDRMFYDELIAPMEATMMRSIWQVVRRVDLAEDSLQDALAIIWKKRFQIRLHPNPPALILKICLNTAYDSLRKLERRRRQTDLSPLDNAPAPSNQDADRDLEAREIEEQVQQAIRRLPRKRALAVMMRLIQEENSNISEIAREIRQDQVISAKILGMCNSAYFSGRVEIASIDRALILLGERQALKLILSAAMENFFPSKIEFFKYKIH